MRQVLLTLSLLLVYTRASEASPISDDQTGLPFRYPVWWRPSEDTRSYWDPLTARLMWTHPAFRRYYKELAGWESTNRDMDRPNLLSILNDYEERAPFMSTTYGEDNDPENEEHLIDIREGPQEEPMDVNTSAESENYGDAENQSNESEITPDEGETAVRMRRSLASNGIVLGVLNNPAQQLPGGLIDARISSISSDSLNRPYTTAKRESTSVVDGGVKPVPSARLLNKVNLDNIDINDLLSDLGVRTMRIDERSADPDYTTDDGSALIDAQVLIGFPDPLELRNKRSVNSILAAKSETEDN